MSKILVAMSGGVDSAVCAALLKRAGHEVAGAMMQLHSAAEQDIMDAKASAERLGIDLYVFSWQKEFFDLVQEPFVETYRAGKTPNPCVLCNKTVKFGLFLDKALELGFEKIATGHYARIEQNADGRYLVRMAKDASKDQTYMFTMLSQRQLSHLVLPMGELTKEQARAIAEELGLAVAHKRDSQDICFLPDGDYVPFLREHGIAPQKGRFLGPDGEVLGTHEGQEAYTIGQRRGLDIAYGTRIYVRGKNGNDVLLGPEASLYSSRVRLTDFNLIALDTLQEPLRCAAKLRYTPKIAPCTVCPTDFGAELVFDEPQRAVTPGQTAALYLDDVLLGGGTIQ